MDHCTVAKMIQIAVLALTKATLSGVAATGVNLQGENYIESKISEEKRDEIIAYIIIAEEELKKCRKFLRDM